MNRISFLFCPLLLGTAFGTTTSLISINFANKNPGNVPAPVVTSAVSGDVTSSVFDIGTAPGNNFVRFGGGSFDVSGFDDFSTVNVSVLNIGNLSGWETGIGTNIPGLGAWIPDSNSNDGAIITPGGSEIMAQGVDAAGNGGNRHRLAVSFDRGVILTRIDTGWWDGAGFGNPETWEVTVGGITVKANPASENTLDLTGTALLQTNFQGVMGVYLAPGETIEFGSSGPDEWAGNATSGALGTDGNLDNGVLSAMHLYVIPEPTSVMLLCFGSVGLIRRRR